MDKLPCAVVLDLLPSYVEGLTSSETNGLIERHLASCPACRAALEAMRRPEPPRRESDAKEIDFLKRMRRLGLRNTLLSALAALVVIAAALGLRFYVIGEWREGDWLGTNVTVSGREVTLTGRVRNELHGVAGVRFSQQGGVVTVRARAVWASFLHGPELEARYEAPDEVTRVVLNGTVVWERGVQISYATTSLYRTRHPYMGDVSADDETLLALDLDNRLAGSHGFSMSLTSSEQPYRLALELHDEVRWPDIAAEEMTRMSCAMLAVIGNLDEVSWTFPSSDGQHSVTVSSGDASLLFGEDIKSCYDDLAALQRLMELLKLD